MTIKCFRCLQNWKLNFIFYGCIISYISVSQYGISIYTNIEDVQIIYFNHIMRNYVYIDRNVQLQTRTQTRIEVFHLNV